MPFCTARGLKFHYQRAGDGPVGRKEGLRITRLETFKVKPRWLFLKVHTDAGIVVQHALDTS